MNALATIRSMAASAPADRNRAVDALRAASILVVVFGHWLMAAVTVRDGELVPGHLLEVAAWTHPLTWVAPGHARVLLVGGYANGRSWRSARRRGEAYGAWLRSRLRRLVLPVVPLLIVWGAGGGTALAMGLDWRILQLASQVALVPTWFLAAYVVVVTIAPLTLGLWERLGWSSVLIGALLAGGADAASLRFGLIPLGFSTMCSCGVPSTSSDMPGWTGVWEGPPAACSSPPAAWRSQFCWWNSALTPSPWWDPIPRKWPTPIRPG